MLLNCHSYYSFKYGTLSVEDLLKEVIAGGFTTIALTDINNTAASLDFVRQCAKFGVRPVVGIDFRNGIEQQYVAIAKNSDGFRELNEFLTLHLHEKRAFLPNAPSFEHACVVYPFISEFRDLKEHEYLGVSPQDLLRLPFTVWKNNQHKLVILQTASFRNKRDYNIHRLLRAIDKNTLLSKLPKSEQADFENQYRSRSELLEIYREYP